MKTSRIKKTLMVLLCAATLFSLTACGSDEPAPEAIKDSEKPQPTETVSENTVVHNETNITAIKDACGASDELATEVSDALETLGFGTIEEWQAIESDEGSKIKIKNVDKTIYYIIMVDENISEIVDENEKQVWLNANIAQVTIKDEADVEVTVTATPPVETEEPADETDLDSTKESNSEVIKSDYCSLEKLDENKFKAVPNDSLSDTTKVSNTTMGKYIASIDEILVKNEFDAINRSMYYDMMSVSFFTRGGVEVELSDPNFSIILAYLSQMFEETAEFKYAEIEKDDAKGYCKFTYYIDNSVIVLDTDGILTWDGADFNIADKVDLIKKSMNVSAQSGADILLEAQIPLVTDEELAKKIVSAIELYYSDCKVTEVVEAENGWRIKLTNEKECLLSYVMTNTNVTLTVTDDSNAEDLKTILTTSFKTK